MLRALVRLIGSIFGVFRSVLQYLTGVTNATNKQLSTNKHVIDEKVNNAITEVQEELNNIKELAAQTIKVHEEKKVELQKKQNELEELTRLKEIALNTGKKEADRLISTGLTKEQVASSPQYALIREEYAKVENALVSTKKEVDEISEIVNNYLQRREKYKSMLMAKSKQIQELQEKKQDLKHDLQNAIEQRKIYEMESKISFSSSTSAEEEIKELENTIKTMSAEATALKDISVTRSDSVISNSIFSNHLNQSISNNFDAMMLGEDKEEKVYPICISSNEMDSVVIVNSKKENNE